MAQSLCHLLMKVNHVIVAIFYVANMSFNTIRENSPIYIIDILYILTHLAYRANGNKLWYIGQ